MQNIPTLEYRWRDWVIGAVVLVCATAFNFLLQPIVGGKLPWLVYFPSLVFTALCAGLGPALLVLFGGLLAALTFWVEPIGTPWPISGTADRIAAFMFTGAGAAVAGVSAFTRTLLRRSRNDKLRLDIALATGNMYAWNWDLSTGKVTLSSKAASFFGSLQTHIDQVWPASHPEDLPKIKTSIESALRNEGEYSFLSRMYRHDDKKLCWVQTRGHVHRDEAGKAIYVSGVTADVTELVLAQEQLRLESQRKDTFLATLAHELRNPMAPIRYATAMLEETATPAQRQWAREVIGRQSAHMARLLDDLLDMSRITRDVIELQPEVFDLRTGIEHAVENARAAYASRHHVLDLLLPPGAVLVQGDVTRIQQVLGNLLDNAAKYTPDGGHVRLQLNTQGSQAIVRISDDGSGIDPSQQAHIFELFVQLQEPGRTAGLGIGLAIVKRLVELHGGSVAVNSAGRGHGTEFTVRLPLYEDQIEPLQESAAPATEPARTGAVLVVDDNVDAAETLAEFLRAIGFSVSTAHNGHDALNAIAEADPAAVLLDLGLPDMSGLEVARRIRSRGGPDRVLIAVTGWGQLGDETAEAGFDLHLVKPVDPFELQRSLDELLARPLAA